MGMDYTFAGTASYKRFNEELADVAKIFGGKENLNRENNQPRFSFPENTNELLVKWFNNPYDYFTPDQTFEIRQEFVKYPEIANISHQIWIELAYCVEFSSGWQIH